MRNLVRCPYKASVSIKVRATTCQSTIGSSTEWSGRKETELTRRPEGRVILLFERLEYLHSLLYDRMCIVGGSYKLRDCEFVVHVQAELTDEGCDHDST